MIRLAIVSSHPIQYNAPFFAELAKQKGIQLKVFYSWQGPVNQRDPGFNQLVTWDIPLLEGYDYEFVNNRAKNPGSHHFSGLDNPEIIKKIKDWKANALLVYGWAFKTHLKVIRHFHKRIPIFFRGDSTQIGVGNKLRFIIRSMVLKWVYQHVDYVFYPGTYSKEYFVQNGVMESQLLHIPHCVDNERFSGEHGKYESQAKQIRHSLGITDESLVVLFSGKLMRIKQPEMLLDAVIQANEKKNYPHVQLVFVGTGPLEKILKKKSEHLTFVHFLGFKNQTEMPIMYRIGDVSVLPSISETWGLAVNEAMACKRSVWVSDKVGCAPDLIEPGVTGEIISAVDLNSLIKVIDKYRCQPKKVMEMNQAAFKKIQDWSTTIAANKVAKYMKMKIEVLD